MVIKLDIKTNIMANNKTITIEHIIGKLDNDFNPDNSDWIPRVPAWCVDAMNELKVLRKVDKKMKLTVINKIAKSKCCLIDDGLKVYDSNGCEVPRADNSKYRCSDTESTPSSTGGITCLSVFILEAAGVFSPALLASFTLLKSIS